jgi:hypothetical protein
VISAYGADTSYGDDVDVVRRLTVKVVDDKVIPAHVTYIFYVLYSSSSSPFFFSLKDHHAACMGGGGVLTHMYDDG